MRYRVRAWDLEHEWTVPPHEDFHARDNAEMRAEWWKSQWGIVRVEIEEVLQCPSGLSGSVHS